MYSPRPTVYGGQVAGAGRRLVVHDEKPPGRKRIAVVFGTGSDRHQLDFFIFP